VNRARLLFAMALVACRRTEPETAQVARESPPEASVDASVDVAAEPTELAKLCALYACTAEPDRIRLADGAVENIVWDDGKTKKTQERIDHPDVEDVFALRYPAPGTAIAPVTDPELDPGRIRIEALFRATYGADARAVSAAMVPVKIAGQTVSFHRRAAPALERVATRIAALLEKDPSLARYFKNLGGTFNPRNIAGTDHASAHSWAIAIDIDTSFADYWRNAPASTPLTWRNRIPQAIVDAFEAEAFVWGGRWFHYDTMHFEYRPELFATPGSRDSH
jgi:hypothetical protein